MDRDRLIASGLVSPDAIAKAAQMPAGYVQPSEFLQATPGTMAAPRALPTKRPREDVYDVANSNFEFGLPLGNRTMPISSLKGGVGRSADDLDRVSSLADQMRGPGGYIERLIVDHNGNVLEGQHRLDALRQIGQTQVPVSVIKDLSQGYDVGAMRAAAGNLHPDQVHGLVSQALQSIHNEGSPQAAMDSTYLPGQWDAPYRAVLGAAQQGGSD